MAASCPEGSSFVVIGSSNKYELLGMAGGWREQMIWIMQSHQHAVEFTISNIAGPRVVS